MYPLKEKILFTPSPSYLEQIQAANKIRENNIACIQNALNGQIYRKVEKKKILKKFL